jgi:hypothetical protein
MFFENISSLMFITIITDRNHITQNTRDVKNVIFFSEGQSYRPCAETLVKF